MKESVNIYTSTCCGVPATKPPCVKPKAQPKPKKFSTLGSWRCGTCNKPCSVTVSPRPPKQEAANG